MNHMWIFCKAKNTTVPGCHYYQRLDRLLESHCRRGEKFIEFVKFECQNKTEGVMCDFCDGKDWVGPHVQAARVPLLTCTGHSIRSGWKAQRGG